MKVAIFALLLIASAFAEVEYATEDGVVVLTDKNFEEAMGSFEFALAEFYAPWCGHCKKLAPEYSAAAQQLAKTNPEIKLVKVDCTVEKDTAAKFEIKGFPTLKFFSKGNAPIAYEGGRTKDEIINWLKKRTGPLSVEVKDVDGAEVIIGNNEVVAFYLGAADTEAHKNFLQAANAFEDLPFAHSHSESVREKYGASSDSIVLFKKFDEKKNVYNGPFDTASIKNFLKTNKDPTVIPFDQKAAQAIFSPSGRDAIFLVRGNNENGAKAEEALRSVANDIKDKVVISVANIEDQLGGRLADYIGINKDALPALRIVQPGKANTKYPFDREITAENIKAFVEDFKNGKLTPFFKSEEIPAQSHEDNVRVLVGKNWKEIVLDETKDVLVEYYAPWCGHCKSLAPTYAAVATRLKDVSDIVVAKMDATANEVEGLSVQGFPTLKFYPRGRKTNPMDYNGERTEEGFIDYFRKNSKASIPERQAPSLDDL